MKVLLGFITAWMVMSELRKTCVITEKWWKACVFCWLTRGLVLAALLTLIALP